MADRRTGAKIGSSPGANRRAQVRHPYAREVPFRYGEQYGTATLQDISASGVGLVLPRQLLPGMMVTVELHDKTYNSWRMKLVRVIHVTPRGAHQWLIGSRFTRELSAAELEGLLA